MLRRTLSAGTLLATTWFASTAHAAFDIGTPAQVLDIVSQSDVAKLKRLILPLDDGSDVYLVVKSYRPLDGYVDMVMTGSVDGDPNALFMLRGTAERIYGWLHFRLQRRAYEFNTDASGLVTVEQVPVQKICSSCDGSPPRATVGPSSNLALGAPQRAMAATATASEPHLGDYPGTDLLTLQSRPGAKKVVYLNIKPILDSSGTPLASTGGSGGSPWTKADMWRVWQTVASGLSAFEVNVTTSPTVFSATATADVGVADYVNENKTAFSYQGTFGTGEYQSTIYAQKPCEPDAMGFGRTSLHETGHQLGMLDAGSGSEAYYPGNATYQWYPIMGNYYYATDNDAVVQWSKGEWSGANSDAKIDALASIAGFLGYRSDDIPDTKVLALSSTGAVTDDSNRGQITGASDTDTFTFQIGSSGGNATLTVDRIEYIGGAMLDVLATLKNSSGTTVATSNPTAARAASISQALTAGTYSLVIQGGSEGTPSNGFGAYSSIGYYGILGTITGAVTTGSGGSSGTGGSGAGGSATGGSATGGSGTGGSGTGGAATGGSKTGGTAAGGATTGGSSTGGAATGGSRTGGAGTGGATSGGSNTGGATTGGSNTGGTGTGGAQTGGSSTGGTATGGAATGGSKTGGTGTGNAATGGSDTGGSATGGAATGGSTGKATGGSNTGGAGTSSAATGGTPSTDGKSTGGAPTNAGPGRGGNASAAQRGPAPMLSNEESSCGCRAAGGNQRFTAGWLVSLLGWLLAVRRRSRRPS